MSCRVFPLLRKSYVHIPAAPPTTLIMFFLLEFLSNLSIIIHMMGVVIDKLRNTCVKHIIIHSLLNKRGSDGTTISPLRTNTSHVMKFGEGINAQSFFSSLTTHGKIILPIHFIHPSPKTSKNMHNNNGASSFFTFGEGSNAQKFFRKYLLPHLPSSSRTQNNMTKRGERETQNPELISLQLFLYPPTQILFLEHGIFFTRQRI